MNAGLFIVIEYFYSVVQCGIVAEVKDLNASPTSGYGANLPNQ